MNIIFFSRIGRPVTGGTVYKTGCGGSESALIYIAKELAKLGHQVKVFVRLDDKPGDYEGVEYIDVKDFVNYLKAQPQIDVFVCFRDLEFLKSIQPFPIKLRIYWAHDDMSYLWDKPGAEQAAFFLNLADRIFAVSRWQAEIYQQYFKVPQEKLFITRNGVNFGYFEEITIRRDRLRLIYTSVPDRGLDILLEIFPKIKEQIPEAELFVFSSFSIYGQCKEAEKERELVGELFERAKRIGIHLMKPVTQKELAVELFKSRLMVYPNHKSTFAPVFGETSCVAALESQAAGVPVITSNRGALSETVLHNKTGILIDGDPYSKEYQDRFVEETVRLLKDESTWERLSQQAKERIKKEYSWSKIAREWDGEFKSRISKP